VNSAKDPGPILTPITLHVLRQEPWWTISFLCITLHVNYSQLSPPKDVIFFLAIKEMTETQQKARQKKQGGGAPGLSERQK
jgi:hypothetical protein